MDEKKRHFARGIRKKVFVTKRTVDGWLSAGKPIPAAKMELIERIVEDSENIQFDLPENIELLLKQKAEEAKKALMIS